MSVTDPLLKQLKNSTLLLIQSSSKLEIDDSNEHLQNFCSFIEKIFQKGLLLRTNALGFLKVPESWYWLEEVATMEHGANYNFISSVNTVKHCQKLGTSVGKLRYLIRVCLVNKCLHIPVEIIVRQKSISQIYQPSSILGDDILGEIFFSVLLQCSRMIFKLDLNNCAFLDETWELPCSEKLEFVPCKHLGISVKFVSGKAIIIGIKSNSVAAEDEKIKVGDILDELNGMHVNLSTRHKLSKVMKKGANKPVLVTIIHAWRRGSSLLFPPIATLLQRGHVELHLEQEQQQSPDPTASSEQLQHASPDTANRSVSGGVPVQYVGSVCTGAEGDVRQIERALLAMFGRPQRGQQSALFEVLEVGVRIVEQSSGQVLLRHSYMEIASCGRTLKFPKHFAYIAGDESCSTAKVFTCYAFCSGDEEHVQNILRSIGSFALLMPVDSTSAADGPGSHIQQPQCAWKTH